MIQYFCIASILFFYGCSKRVSIKQTLKSDSNIEKKQKAEDFSPSAFYFEKVDQQCDSAPDLLLAEILNNKFLQLTGLTLPINTRIICSLDKPKNNAPLTLENLLPETQSLYHHYIGQSETSLPQLHSYFQQMLAQEGWQYKNRKTEEISIFDAKKINRTLTLIIRPHDNNAQINNLHFLVKQKNKD